MRLPEIKSVTLAFLTALLFALVYNAHMGVLLVDILKKVERVNPLFIMTVPFAFVAFFNAAFLLLSPRFMQKAATIALSLFSSAISYASFHYGIIFDDNMFENIAQTDTGEALSYLNLSLVLWLLLAGLLPAILVWKIPLEKQGWKKEFAQKSVSFALSLCALGVIAFFFYPDYASTVRNNVVLRKIIVPSYALKNGFDYLTESFGSGEKQEKKPLGTDALQEEEERFKRKYLIVLVLGETQRAQNYSLGGYERKTNPFTEKQGGYYFKNASSCGTATAVSVPCMFSFLGHEGYSKEAANSQDDFLDVLVRQGTRVLWLDNDAGCKDTCSSAEFIDIREKYKDRADLCDIEGCLDEAVAEEFRKILPTLEKKDTVVVLHMMGSHGPKYWKRYPREYAVFTPDCQQGDIQNCSREELVNAYDNTIYYEDKVISDVIDAMRRHEKGWNSVMVFMSDHGESLGEKGLYLHGLPYAVAPEEQTRVPLYVWLSKNFLHHEGDDMNDACLRKRVEEGVYSHDSLPHAVLGLLDIDSAVYKPELNFLRDCEALK